MRLLYLLFACIVFSVTACEFSPTGNNFEEIDPNPVNDISIGLNNSIDTIFARGAISLKVKLDVPGKNIKYYQLLIDGKIIKQDHSASIPVYLDTKAYADGPHEIKVLLASSTGTNSMADKAGAEMLQVYRTWVLMLDNAPPTPVAITKVAVEDGTLKLEWEKYKRRDIKSIVVSRRYSNGGLVYSRTLSPDVTTWTDASYLGGPAYYTVKVVDPDGRTAESTTANITTTAPSLLNSEYINGNDLKLTFSSSRLYRNFGRYRVFFNGEPESAIENTSITDSVFIFRDVPFGADFNMLFQVIAKDEEFSYYRSSETFSVKGFGHENEYGSFYLSHYSAYHNLFYDFYSTSISILDGSTLQLKHQGTIQNSIAKALAPGGEYLYAVTKNNMLLHVDPTNLEIISSYNLMTIIPDLQYTRLLLEVSNDNRLLVYSRNYYTRVDHLYVVDMHTRQVELTHEQPYFESSEYSISPDGNMVTAFNWVFRKQPNGQWQSKQVFPTTYATIGYHPTQPLYFHKGLRQLNFYSTANDALIKTIPSGDNVYPAYVDHATGYLIAGGNKTLYIYDINKNLVLKEIKIAPNNSGVIFLKDKLFTRGYYFPLTF